MPEKDPRAANRHTAGARVSDEDFQEILAQTRQFVRTAVVPREQEILDDDRVPDDLRDQAKKMGLFGYAIPQEWGGLGLNLMQDVELAMELGYTSLALRSMFGTNNGSPDRSWSGLVRYRLTSAQPVSPVIDSAWRLRLRLGTRCNIAPRSRWT